MTIIKNLISGVINIKNKRIIFLIIGLLIALIIWNLKLPGLSLSGRKMFSLTIMTVIFWAAKVTDSAYTASLFLMLLLIFEIAPAEKVLSLWTSHTVYLVIGAYLIAAAVKSSGLGERIAYKFIIRFVDSYRSIIISIFALTFLLSLIIPHPWPRAFIIMSVMSVVIENAGRTGCSAADSVDATIYRQPETKNLYYVPNDFDQ